MAAAATVSVRVAVDTLDRGPDRPPLAAVEILDSRGRQLEAFTYDPEINPDPDRDTRSGG